MQTAQSKDLSTDGQYAYFGAWEGENYQAADLIKGLHNAAHPTDIRQSVLAFCGFNKYRKAAVKEPSEGHNTDPVFQISKAAGLQKGCLRAAGTGSSRFHDIIVPVRASLFCTYPPCIPELAQGVLARPIHRSRSSILTTKDSQLPRSAIEPPDQVFGRSRSLHKIQIWGQIRVPHSPDTRAKIAGNR